MLVYVNFCNIMGVCHEERSEGPCSQKEKERRNSKTPGVLGALYNSASRGGRAWVMGAES